jgi:hypothetical protein
MSVTYFSVPKKSLDRLRDWKPEDPNKEKKLVTMDYTFSHDQMCMAASRENSLTKVFAIPTTRNVADLPSTFGEYTFSAEKDKEDKPAADNKETEKTSGPIYHELAQPSVLYNWEIGLHSVLLVMDRLSATQQFDKALQVARLVFDPSINVQLHQYIVGITGSKKNIEKESCWRFPLFQDIARKLNQKRGDPEAYIRRIIMKYAVILISASDMHFSRGTLERLPLAIQR